MPPAGPLHQPPGAWVPPPVDHPTKLGVCAHEIVGYELGDHACFAGMAHIWQRIWPTVDA